MRTPIVMLHHVGDEPELDSLKPYAISRSSFIRLLDGLEEAGFSTAVFNNQAVPSASIYTGKKAVLSFDDCPRHLWDFAIPELLRRGMKAAFYMPTAHIGGYNEWDAREGRSRVELMKEVELRELSKLGMEVGAHGHRHIRLADAEDEKEILDELKQSRTILEQITGQSIVSMAYPFGSVPRNHWNLLTQAGYQYGLSIYQPRENRYALRRFIYHDGDTVKTLRQKLSRLYGFYRSLTDQLK